jgi:hypothetical protein
MYFLDKVGISYGCSSIAVKLYL